MVYILAAVTLPVNPSSPKPKTIITRQQLYAGLVAKCLRPQDFVGAMSACEVTSQTDTEIIRTVTFKEGMGPPGGNGKLEERITLDGGMKATFYQPTTTSTITNLISVGPAGPEDLYLTFTFSWAHPEISSAESPEAVEKQKGYVKGGLAVVGHTIEVIREMVEGGRL